LRKTRKTSPAEPRAKPDSDRAGSCLVGRPKIILLRTNQPDTIGHAVSSGCFRLNNADVIDLYDRVQVGAKVLVKQSIHVS
jgi:L,D-transpeptidase catalytic domain